MPGICRFPLQNTIRRVRTERGDGSRVCRTLRNRDIVFLLSLGDEGTERRRVLGRLDPRRLVHSDVSLIEYRRHASETPPPAQALQRFSNAVHMCVCVDVDRLCPRTSCGHRAKYL